MPVSRLPAPPQPARRHCNWRRRNLQRLVVMDIRLAGDRDGIDTALELFRSHGIRCIFASAYSDQEAQRRAAPAAPLGWLQKPYTMASLTAKVREALRELRSRPD